MKKVISFLFITLCLMSFAVNTAFAKVNNKDNSIVFEICNNFAEFSNVKYEYDLNEYFENGEIKYVKYELISVHIGNEISLVENVLTVTPAKNLKEVVRIRATDRNGDYDYATFKLRFIDAYTYIKGWLWGIMLVLVVALVVLIYVSLFSKSIEGGRVIVKNGKGETLATIERNNWWKKHVMKTPYGLLTGKGECLKFIPKRSKNIYIIDDGNIVKIGAYPLYPGNSVVLYLDKACTADDAVKIIFQKI